MFKLVDKLSRENINLKKILDLDYKFGYVKFYWIWTGTLTDSDL